MGPTATKLGSWVYLFSKFTPEALLFEAFAILCLMAAYLAFWVLRKRRMGSIENAVPAGLVKVYLNQLIGEAEQLRAQLFGLLTGASPAAGQQAALRAMTPDLLASISAQLPGAPATGGDSKQLQALEAKMNEQAKAMEAVLVEKRRIEKELADARAAGSKTGGAVDDGMIAKLQEKIRILEGKLAEYSVIEDDLANLKRLQQENAQLRAALNKAGGSVADVPAAQPAAAAPAPSGGPAPAPAVEGPPSPEPEPKVAASPAAEPAVPEPIAQAAAPVPAAQPTAAPAAVPGEAAADAGFEALVDEVEKSLTNESTAPGGPVADATAQPTAPDGPAAAASGGPAATTPALESILTSAAAPGGASQEKTDADLVAEFEKMLKG